MQKVLRLSIAGLRYWCELGLQPVGGQKNISALIVCEVGDGMKRAAALFLARMAEVYHVRTDECASLTGLTTESDVGSALIISGRPRGQRAG